MVWLIHNPIADIHGPTFLLVYCIIALAVIAVAYGIVRLRDNTGSREPPPVPPALDPYELAYLRGGENAVMQTAVYALYQRGLVKIIPKTKLKRSQLVATETSSTEPLTDVEKCALEALDRPVDPSSLFLSNAAKGVERLCEPFRNRLEAAELLRTSAASRTAVRIAFMAGAVLVSLTLYKIALAEGRPFGFLVGLTILSLIALWAVVGSLALMRISSRGNAYLKRLQVAYQNMGQPAARGTGPAPQTLPPGAPSVAMVGLFGLGILSTTPDDAIASFFALRVSGDVGGSCSGGSGGGGGCGGGGGGCGS